MTREFLQKKMDKVAQSYCENHVKYMLWDCCDSMHGMDEDEAKWELLTDNKLNLVGYIRENFKDYYLEQVKDAMAENGQEISDLTESEIGALLVKPNE